MVCMGHRLQCKMAHHTNHKFNLWEPENSKGNLMYSGANVCRTPARLNQEFLLCAVIGCMWSEYRDRDRGGKISLGRSA